MKAGPNEEVIYSGHPSWKSMLDFHLASLLAAAVVGVIVRLASSNTGYAIAAFAAFSPCRF
jgi:hypothetical protein